MLPTLAPVSELERRLGVAAGSLAGLDLARAEAALEDASVLVRLEGRAWVADDGVTITAPDAAILVALRAAERAYRNPDNYQGESIGDGSYAWQAGQGDAEIYLSPNEVRLVKRAASANGSGGVGTTRTPPAYYDILRDPARVSNAIVWELP